jgi:hypothetical protein
VNDEETTMYVQVTQYDYDGDIDAFTSGGLPVAV